MKNIQLNNRSLRSALAAVRRGFYGVPYVVLIKRFRFVRLILLVLLGVVALYVVVRLLYFESRAVTDVSESPIILQTEGLDELEVWLEDRQIEAERPIITGGRAYFKR